jgi:galactose-1-phosphate uridylyltransferase
MLGNTVRFRGRTTPDKIPSVMISHKIFFNSGNALNTLDNITPWKLVSFRNIFMPVSSESMTDAINVTATDCG